LTLLAIGTATAVPAIGPCGGAWLAAGRTGLSGAARPTFRRAAGYLRWPGKWRKDV